MDKTLGNIAPKTARMRGMMGSLNTMTPNAGYLYGLVIGRSTVCIHRGYSRRWFSVRVAHG